ncbi:MAG: DUF4373 domain-containing protein [Desulfobulbaceae bacterium]|nr:DUF4373 domain-containing protein [Desulfobulbaceae bacterium]
MTLLVAGLVVAGQTPSQAEKLDQKNIRVAFNQQVPLQEALTEIYRQTGYKVYVSEELAQLNIQGVYWDLSIDEFLRRALKKYNVSVVYDDNAQIATVRGFGENLGRSGGEGNFVSVSGDELSATQAEDPGAIEPLSGIPYATLRELQEQQLAEMKKQLTDPDALDPFSGASYPGISESQAEVDRQREEPDAVDPLSEVPIATLKENQAKLDEQRERGDVVDPLSGAPYSVLRENQRQLDMKRENSDMFDPLSEVTQPLPENAE